LKSGEQLHLILTSALDGSEWSASHLSHFIPSKRDSSTHWTGACLGSRTSLVLLETRKFHPSPGSCAERCPTNFILMTTWKLQYGSCVVSGIRKFLQCWANWAGWGGGSVC